MAKTPKPTEKQVAAWLYMVVGPTITGLVQEGYFLNTQKNPTWRFSSGKCDFVHSVPAYVEAAQRPTLNQFLRFNPKIGKLVEAHDTALSDLEEAAREACNALAELPAFKALAARIEEEFKDWRGGCRPEDGPRLLAQGVIDWAHLPEVPAQYTNAAAWKKHGPEALRFRQDPTVAKTFQKIDAALERLTKSSSKLKETLDGTRDDLADRYGLPPASPTAPEVVRLEAPEKF